MRETAGSRFYNWTAIFFIFLFAYTAFSKLLDFDHFRITLAQSPLLGDHYGWLSIFIPSIELLLAILLVVPRARLWGMYGTAVLMLLFSAYIAYMLVRGGHLPCSCGGVLKQMSWKQHLWFNLLLTVAAMVATGLRMARVPDGSEINERKRLLQ